MLVGVGVMCFDMSELPALGDLFFVGCFGMLLLVFFRSGRAVKKNKTTKTKKDQKKKQTKLLGGFRC